VSFVELVLAIVKILIVVLFLLNMAAIATWADRRQSAMVQDRVGPNRAVVWVPSAIAKGIVAGPPALFAFVAAFFSLRPVHGRLAYDRMTVELELAILVGWFSLLLLLGHVKKHGSINALEEWLARVSGRSVFYTGLALHAAGLVLVRVLDPEAASVGAKVCGLLLAGVFAVVGGYAASRVPDGKIGIRLAGTLHAAADAMKMIWKEDFIPKNGDRLLHGLAPILAMFPALVTFAVIPFGTTMCFQDGGTKGWDFTDLGRLLPVVSSSGICPANAHAVTLQIADLNVGILYLFAMGGTGIVGAALAGWASDNKFSLLGGLRAASQMVSYEVAMGLSLCGLFLIYGSVRMLPMVEWQGAYAWGIFVQPLAFVLFLTALGAETKRVPFDQPEGESEIVAGYFVEYSGMKFGMFMTGEYIELITSSALLVTLFFGGFQLPFLHPDGITVAFGDHVLYDYKMTHLAVVLVSVVAFFGKTIFVTFIQIFFRWTLPRFRYDQLMNLGWTKLLPLAIANLLLTGLVVLAIDAGGAEVASVMKIAGDVTQAIVAFGMIAGAVAFVTLFLEPIDRQKFLRSSTARFAAAAGGVKPSPQQA
jgi:NADH-quinone oxidoreductase subunit H